MNDRDRKRSDDVKLLKRARGFDEEALTAIFQSYHDAMYRYIYHHLGSAQVAEDLASEVFRRFLQALRDGGGPTRQLSAWLYRVAHNLIVDELRRRKHRNHESLDGPLSITLQADTDSLDSLAGQAIATDRLRRALFTLTEDQRQVVVLKFLQGLSNAEVAEITGKTIGAVKALQHRGLDVLRSQLLASQAPAPARTGGERALASSSAN